MNWHPLFGLHRPFPVGRSCFASSILTLGLLTLIVSEASAVLIIDPAAPIIEVVTVQPIILSDSNGNNTAEFFGNPIEQANIESLIDSIWAQAGIDITFLAPSFWNDDFANMGTSGNNSPRPTTDLSATVAAASTANQLHADANVINMFFVEIAAGFSQTSDNTVNGLAFVGGNGVSQHVGDNLVGFPTGLEIIASVVSHEIGHNLGLFHIVEFQNLMQASGSPDQGEMFNATQIATALASNFSVSAVPEPSAFLFLSLVSLGGLVLKQTRRRAKG